MSGDVFIGIGSIMLIGIPLLFGWACFKYGSFKATYGAGYILVLAVAIFIIYCVCIGNISVKTKIITFTVTTIIAGAIIRAIRKSYIEAYEEELIVKDRELKYEIQQKFNSGNYYSVLEDLKKYLMNSKDTEFYHRLGYMYENGYGTTKDYSKAMECYKKADAWREMGYMHYFGYGVPKDKKKAYRYFEISGDKTDCDKVIECFERIANHSDDATALYNLGYFYAEGKGMYQDYQKALYYYQKAADLGSSNACNNLGVMYNSGKGVERNYSLAVKYYQKSADLGNAVACNNVGRCYEYGDGGLFGAKSDKYKALKYYKKAYNLGDREGCENYKRLKNAMGITNDDDVLF